MMVVADQMCFGLQPAVRDVLWIGTELQAEVLTPVVTGALLDHAQEGVLSSCCWIWACMRRQDSEGIEDGHRSGKQPGYGLSCWVLASSGLSASQAQAPRFPDTHVNAL